MIVPPHPTHQIEWHQNPYRAPTGVILCKFLHWMLPVMFESHKARERNLKAFTLELWLLCLFPHLGKWKMKQNQDILFTKFMWQNQVVVRLRSKDGFRSSINSTNKSVNRSTILLIFHQRSYLSRWIRALDFWSREGLLWRNTWEILYR